MLLFASLFVAKLAFERCLEMKSTFFLMAGSLNESLDQLYGWISRSAESLGLEGFGGAAAGGSGASGASGSQPPRTAAASNNGGSHTQVLDAVLMVLCPSLRREDFESKSTKMPPVPEEGESQPKPVKKKVKSKTKSVNWGFYIMKVLRQVHPTLRISKQERAAVGFVADSMRAEMDKLGYQHGMRISKYEFEQLLVEPQIAQVVDAVGVDVVILCDMLEIIYEDAQRKGQMGMQFEEMVELVLSMRGSNPATVKDVKEVVRINKILLYDLERKLTERLRSEVEDLKAEIQFPKLNMQFENANRSSAHVGAQDWQNDMNEAMTVMVSCVEDTFDRISMQANRLCRRSGSHSINTRDIQSAVRLVFPGELSRHAVSEGCKAVINHKQSGGGRMAAQAQADDEELAEEAEAEEGDDE
ncbi:HTB1 [Symbiodinium microadriaticum]|nr:HTB1 [Symbiodinium microadriaticum]